MTLVDTSVLIDVATDDPNWADWSQQKLELAALRGPLLINEIIYAELSVGFDRIEELNAFLAGAGIEMHYLPAPALFLAGKAFTQYRRAGGARSSILADFFVGAHAATAQLPLLTRDARKYQTYFSDIEVIAPARD
ncbi:type II toxin-antitoxin system VapC family toxin [Devosia sp. Root635]|uniref:type II toxin-antitoxin system VapC family toxin n=1 Tax=Devosia sp. Root635 TaxID=1736575 RepID=UPI0006FBAB98|nr:type II toxin-antitoxin system VapC family toxin [Devosia sp. Root635]KRA47800.1 DNA-binding protein [Devosia sp. Root635]